MPKKLAEKKYVVAFTHAQARHFAQSMDWKRSEWIYVYSPLQLKGLDSVLLFNVRAPGYRADKAEGEQMQAIQDEILTGLGTGRIAKCNVVNLP